MSYFSEGSRERRRGLPDETFSYCTSELVSSPGTPRVSLTQFAGE